MRWLGPAALIGRGARLAGMSSLAPCLCLDLAGIRLHVDGDVLEVFFGTKTERIALDKIAVRLERRRKERVQISVQVANDSSDPVYAWGWAPTIRGHIVMIDAADEPAFRQFFTQVAAACGRDVPAVTGSGSTAVTAGEPGHRPRGRP
jgi:hypothetical protein